MTYEKRIQTLSKLRKEVIKKGVYNDFGRCTCNNQGTAFTYSVDLESKKIFIVDLDEGGKTVTNALDEVLTIILSSSIFSEQVSFSDYTILYSDSEGDVCSVIINTDGKVLFSGTPHDIYLFYTDLKPLSLEV